MENLRLREDFHPGEDQFDNEIGEYLVLLNTTAPLRASIMRLAVARAMADVGALCHVLSEDLHEEISTHVTGPAIAAAVWEQMETELREADTKPFLEEEVVVGEHCILRSDAGVWDDCRVTEVDAEYIASDDDAPANPEVRYERRGAQSLKPLSNPWEGASGSDRGCSPATDGAQEAEVLRHERLEQLQPEPEPEPALALAEPEPEPDSANESEPAEETAPTFRFKVHFEAFGADAEVSKTSKSNRSR